jgi:hypothetical protein
MSVQDVLALVVAGGAVLYTVRWVRRSLGGKGGCGCEAGNGACRRRSGPGNSHGPSARYASARPISPRPIPFVPADQVGRPSESPQRTSEEKIRNAAL